MVTISPESRVGGWRPYALALLPLAMAGALPWWATGLLCLLYGLSVRYRVWQDGRLLVGLLIVGLSIVAALPELRGPGQMEVSRLLDNLQWQYLARLLMLGLVSCAAGGLEEGERRSLWFVLLAGLLAPQPLLVVALAAGAAARPGLDDRRGGAATWQVPAAPQAGAGARWLWPALFVTLLTALSLGLPRYAPTTAPHAANATAKPTKPTPASAIPAPLPPSSTATGQAPPVVIQPDSPDRSLHLPPGDLLVGLALLLSGLVIVNLISRTARKSVGVNLVDILMSASLLLTLALWFLFAATTQRSGQGGAGDSGQTITANGRAAPHSAKTVVRRPALVPVVWALFWLVAALLVALSGLLAWMLWHQYRSRPRLATTRPEPLAPDATPEQIALHRVRVAYRQASEALNSRGWGRGAAETPLSYAARLGAQFPALAGPLATLTAAYDPVRYGGKVTEDEADSAEAAALKLETLAGQLPSPAAPDEPDPSPTPLAVQELS